MELIIISAVNKDKNSKILAECWPVNLNRTL